MSNYIVKHRNFMTRIRSKSGGFFIAIANYILNCNGIVYGVILENNIKAEYIRAENKKELEMMQGAKYIQASGYKVFKKVKEDLENRRIVLFVGTNCQILGLLNFLGNKYENLVTMNINCHGVFSPKLWKDYVYYMKDKYGKEIVRVDFKDKYKYGWAASIETFYLSDGSTISDDFYNNVIERGVTLRPSCYECQFSTTKNIADFSIGDAVGISKDRPELNDDNGISLVITNTNKAEKIFNELKNDLEIYICNDISKYKQSKSINLKEREKFYKYYLKNGFNKTIIFYKRYLILNKVIKKIFQKIGIHVF